MADISAKDVQALRQASGAGMMDAKRALQETNGDFDSAMQWLREKGMAASAKRADRENAQGAVAVSVTPNGAAIVELKCETDFVAKNEDFVNLVNELANMVASSSESAVNEKKPEIDNLNVVLKENIALGQVIRFQPESGRVVDSYLHIQADRGVNGVLVELEEGSPELAHDIAVHIAFAKPKYLFRDDVPVDELEHQRATYEAIARNEGKPDAALSKIVEGRVQGFYKEVVLTEQPYAKDEKQTIGQLLGSAKVTRFAQVVVGA